MMEGCPFKVQYDVTNTQQFEKKRENAVYRCNACGAEARFVPCSARRYLSYGKKSLTVYHHGQYTCPVVKTLKSKNVESIEDLVQKNPNIKPPEVQSKFIISGFQQEMDLEIMKREAASQ